MGAKRVQQAHPARLRKPFPYYDKQGRGIRCAVT